MADTWPIKGATIHMLTQSYQHNLRLMNLTNSTLSHFWNRLAAHLFEYYSNLKLKFLQFS
jgi:hypothetical protein